MESEAIANLLGDRKVLGKAVRKPVDLADLIRKGLPANSVRTLAVKPSLGNTPLLKKLGNPQRTMTRRWSQRSRLTPAESDPAVRFARIYPHAVAMIGDEKRAVQWLLTSNRALGGE